MGNSFGSLASGLLKALLPMLIEEFGRRKGRKVADHFTVLLQHYETLKDLDDKLGEAATAGVGVTLTTEEVVALDKLCDELSSIALRVRS